MVTPFAVFSLIAAAVGGQADLGNTFENVAYLVLACCFGFVMQFLIVHGLIFGLITKSNPLGYFKYIVPAQTMAFACASSAATIPVTLRSVRSTGRVPESIIKFVVPLGATINMDGSGTSFAFVVANVGRAPSFFNLRSLPTERFSSLSFLFSHLLSLCVHLAGST
jgi:Na+/H+-dicarboxylate symporter